MVRDDTKPPEACDITENDGSGSCGEGDFQRASLERRINGHARKTAVGCRLLQSTCGFCQIGMQAADSCVVVGRLGPTRLFACWWAVWARESEGLALELARAGKPKKECI